MSFILLLFAGFWCSLIFGVDHGTDFHESILDIQPLLQLKIACLEPAIEPTKLAPKVRQCLQTQILINSMIVFLQKTLLVQTHGCC